MKTQDLVVLLAPMLVAAGYLAVRRAEGAGAPAGEGGEAPRPPHPTPPSYPSAPADPPPDLERPRPLGRTRYFRPEEFRRGGVDWWPLMSPELLELLDRFRAELGVPVAISPAAGALGRHLGPEATSQHNVDRWGEVRAADVMPPLGVSLARAFEAARAAGARGIGVYPDWQPRPGLHLDVRADRSAYAPALWGGIRTATGQLYVGIDRVLASVRSKA